MYNTIRRVIILPRVSLLPRTPVPSAWPLERPPCSLVQTRHPHQQSTPVFSWSHAYPLATNQGSRTESASSSSSDVGNDAYERTASPQQACAAPMAQAHDSCHPCLHHVSRHDKISGSYPNRPLILGVVSHWVSFRETNAQWHIHVFGVAVDVLHNYRLTFVLYDHVTPLTRTPILVALSLPPA